MKSTLYLLSFLIAMISIPFVSASSAQTPTPTVELSGFSQGSDEEAAILPYYNNYLSQYRLGPEDVISIEVFGQPNYSRASITIPPTARISYPLIQGGLFVGGKTTEELAAIVRRHLDEYIIDPQVTVTLEKVGSARFSVLGLVAQPGVKPMTRRYNVYEAIAEAGGISKEGDRKRVVLIRMTANGTFSPTVIDLTKVVSGTEKVPYLLPGDQLVVPEKKWSLTKILDTVGRVSAIRVLLGSPL